MRGSVSSVEEAGMAVAGAELMFLTNLTATKIIKMAKMGYTAGVMVQGLIMAGSEAALELLVDGEINYEWLARNLVINVGVDFGIGILSGWARRGRWSF